MKSILKVTIVFLFIFFVFISCETDNGLADYIGTWLINGTFLYNDESAESTFDNTLNITFIYNADMTFTQSGTSTVEGVPTTTTGDGTYTVDEGAGTMDFIYLNYSEDGTPKDYDIPIIQYDIQGDTLTLTWPAGLDYSPGEPLVFTRQ